MELFREEWGVGLSPVQWNLVHSEPHTLRGFHVHLENFDYLSVISGTMDLRIVDLRKDSSTFGDSFHLLLQAQLPRGSSGASWGRTRFFIFRRKPAIFMVCQSTGRLRII